MRRRLLILASGLSLLLCGATIGVWVRSYWSYDSVEYDISHYTKDWDWKCWTLHYNRGELYSTLGHHHTDDMSGPAFELNPPEGRRCNFRANGSTIEQMWITEEAGTLIEWQGFYFRLDRRHDTGWYENTLCVAMPAWSVVLIAALLPFGSVLGRMRLKYRKHYDLCLACGYNLKAKTSDICPECGTAIPPRPRPT